MTLETDGMMSEIRKAALALAPMIRDAADEIEEGRRLPPRIADALKQAGVFSVAMPKAWGGPELSIPEQTRIVETLSYFDGSVGWCAIIGLVGAYFAAMLPEQSARELYSDINAPSAGSVLFAGKARRVDGGYRVSGRWPFNSGCQHASTFGFSCHVFDQDDHTLKRPDGSPEMLSAYMTASKVEVLDTWFTTGLRGSGSHDVEVRDVFVPAAHTTSFPELRPRRDEPLYRHPAAFAYPFPAVALGIARHAIDAFIEIANQRMITMASLGGQKVLLRTSPNAQTALARAEGLVRSARALAYSEIDSAWATLEAGGQLSLEARANFAIAVTTTHRNCVQAIDLLYQANGGSSVYARCPLERCFRDIHTLSQHHFTSAAIDESAGQALLGLNPRDLLY